MDKTKRYEISFCPVYGYSHQEDDTGDWCSSDDVKRLEDKVIEEQRVSELPCGRCDVIEKELLIAEDKIKELEETVKLQPPAPPLVTTTSSPAVKV